MNFIDEENSGNELGHTIVDILVDDLVDLSSQLVGYFRLLRFHQLTHHGHDVLPPLRSRIGHVQVVESHVLDDLLPLVDISLKNKI